MRKLEEDLDRQAAAALLDYENDMEVFVAARQKRETWTNLKPAKMIPTKSSRSIVNNRRSMIFSVLG